MQPPYLDHGGRLRIGELLDAPLTGHNVAHLRRQIRVLLLLTDLQGKSINVDTVTRATVPGGREGGGT